MKILLISNKNKYDASFKYIKTDIPCLIHFRFYIS